MKDYPVWLVTQQDITPEEIKLWGLLPEVGFWYIELDSQIATYLQLANRGRATRVPAIAHEYLRIYGDPLI